MFEIETAFVWIKFMTWVAYNNPINTRLQTAEEVLDNCFNKKLKGLA